MLLELRNKLLYVAVVLFLLRHVQIVLLINQSQSLFKLFSMSFIFDDGFPELRKLCFKSALAICSINKCVRRRLFSGFGQLLFEVCTELHEAIVDPVCYVL